MTDDAELLRHYAETGAENSFAELVRRRIDFVYASALRQANGNTALAADVTQMVLTDLARKAASLARHTALVGWLHTATRFTTARAIRTESRRQAREHAAHVMEETLRESAPPADWVRLQPVLDEMLGELKERERTAILLRFFEGRALAEVGASLSLSEPAARSCVNRALDKMRDLLARRGVTSTTAALSVALGSQVSVAAPAGLAASVSSAALVGAASSAGALATLGAFFTMSKIKGGIVSVLVLAGITTAMMELRANRALHAELDGIQAGNAETRRMQQENQRLTASFATLGNQNPAVDELARLRSRAAQLKARPEGVVDSAMKPASAWSNVGWATPETTLETVMWALASGNHDALVDHAPWIGAAKSKADAAFARLPDAIRARYGTADRLLGVVGFGSRGPANDEEVRHALGPVVAFQVIDTFADVKRGGVRVRWWERTATGEEREQAVTFVRDGEDFTVGTARWSESLWQNILAQLDPVTGEPLPRKIPPVPAKSEK